MSLLSMEHDPIGDDHGQQSQVTGIHQQSRTWQTVNEDQGCPREFSQEQKEMGQRWGWGPTTTYMRGSHLVDKHVAKVHPKDKCRVKIHPRYKHGAKVYPR